MAQSVSDRGGIDGKLGGRVAVDIEKDSAFLHFLANVFKCIFSDGLKKRVAWGDPVTRRVLFEDFLIENDLFVFAAKLSEP
jgi:hypothetical protein